MFGLLSAHGAHHVAQINHVATGQFGDEAVTWEAMREHMLTIADAIAEALARYFRTDFEVRDLARARNGSKRLASLASNVTRGRRFSGSLHYNV